MPAPDRPGPPAAVLVAVAAVAGGWLSVRLLPPRGADPPVAPAAARALAALGAPGARARVVRTVDGDTALLRFRDARGPGTATVRYLGVDAPESVHPRRPVECFGPAAARANRRWATGRLVALRFDRERTDPYGRLLAALRPIGARATLSARLVATGHARVLTIPPNGRDAAALRRLERGARRAGRGMWRACRDGLRSDG